MHFCVPRYHAKAEPRSTIKVWHTGHRTKSIWGAASWQPLCQPFHVQVYSQVKTDKCAKVTQQTQCLSFLEYKRKKSNSWAYLGTETPPVLYLFFCVFPLHFFFTSKSHLDLYKIRSGEKCHTETKCKWKEDLGWDTLQINHRASSYSAPPPHSLAHTCSHSHICPS